MSRASGKREGYLQPSTKGPLPTFLPFTYRDLRMDAHLSPALKVTDAVQQSNLGTLWITTSILDELLDTVLLAARRSTLRSTAYAAWLRQGS